MKKSYWILIGIIIVLVLGGSFYAGRMMHRPTVVTRSHQTAASSSSVAHSASSHSASDQGEKLDYETITPMQTAAAIAYYGQHKVHRGIWKQIFTGSADLDIYQNDNADGLNVKGRGNSWMLHPSDEGGSHMATYTVGADGEVAFYDVGATNEDEDKDPYTTVNLRTIINYVNDNGAVGQIKDKAQNIHLKQSQGGE
ncbi:MAG: hypothetical protein ACI4UB_07555 [Limosilactobacillus sp.]